jgi:stress response protein YsnF
MGRVAEVHEWRGRTVVDCDGGKIGKLDEIYLDRATNEPECALVKTGLLGIDQAMADPEITESEHEVTLKEEEPGVEKRTVSKERVRLDKDVQTGEEQVSEQVRN